MIRLAKERALSSIAIEEASSEGFLVSDFTEQGYKELLQRAEYFYVAESDSILAGFVVAYGRDRIAEDEWLNMTVAESLYDFTVIKQICVRRDVTLRGIATRLYEKIIERAGTLPLIAAVVTDPINRPSSALHRKMGFSPMTTITPPDGLSRTVWLRQPAETRLLERQMMVALDLYKHEDLLNWQKLNNFLYVSVGLVAAFGFTIGQPRANVAAILIATGAVGAAVSIAFYVTLSAGIVYLQGRKQALAFLERNLLLRRGTPVLFGAPQANESTQAILRRSPTQIVLQTLPLAGLIGWVLLMGVGIFQLWR